MSIKMIKCLLLVIDYDTFLALLFCFYFITQQKRDVCMYQRVPCGSARGRYQTEHSMHS